MVKGIVEQVDVKSSCFQYAECSWQFRDGSIGGSFSVSIIEFSRHLCETITGILHADLFNTSTLIAQLFLVVQRWFYACYRETSFFVAVCCVYYGTVFC